MTYANGDMESPENTAAAAHETAEEEERPRFRRRWIALVLALIMLSFVMAEVIDPFGGEEYLPISHGDHYHYVPQDRNPDVPISQFPTFRPGPNERITPDGRVVPVE